MHEHLLQYFPKLTINPSIPQSTIKTDCELVQRANDLLHKLMNIKLFYAWFNFPNENIIANVSSYEWDKEEIKSNRSFLTDFMWARWWKRYVRNEWLYLICFLLIANLSARWIYAESWGCEFPWSCFCNLSTLLVVCFSDHFSASTSD